MRSRTSFVALGTIAALAIGYWAARARASGIASDRPMYYAGSLEESGAPVTGDRDIHVVFWNDATGAALANRVCETASINKVPVTSGRFRVALDGGCTQAVHDNPDVWVEVIIEGESMGRQKLGAVPFAVEAAAAASATGDLKAQLTSLARPIVTLPSSGKSTSLSGLYCGSSSAVAGNIATTTDNGYANAKGLCEKACSSTTAHVCSADEMVRYASLGGTIPANGWYQTAAIALISETSTNWIYSYDCAGWTAMTSTQLGAVWNAKNYPGSAACTNTNPMLCCD